MHRLLQCELVDQVHRRRPIGTTTIYICDRAIGEKEHDFSADTMRRFDLNLIIVMVLIKPSSWSKHRGHHFHK